MVYREVKEVSPKLSICIVNYNAKEYLKRCLSSIFLNPPKAAFEVIVVDNASQDGSVSMIKEMFPEVKIMKNQSNLWFIKANNLALKRASGQYILCLNNDTVVLKNSLDKLVEFMDKHMSAGACGPKILKEDGSIQHQCKRGFPTLINAFFYFSNLYKLFPKNKKANGYLLTYLDINKMQEVDVLSGACLLVRREIIKEVGLMDEDFVMYGDDIDWCYRIKKAGWRIFYVPSATVIHYSGKGGSKMHNLKSFIEFHKAMFTFYKKHYSKGNPLLQALILYAIVFIAIHKVLFSFLKQQFSD